jgi:hypothetical protein
VTGRISIIAAGGDTWKFVIMQSAISGHWPQSVGPDLSGQQGIPAAISAISAAAIGAVPSIPLPVFADAESGAKTSPAIRKTASSRERWIKMFTRLFSHDPAAKESQREPLQTSPGSLIRQNFRADDLICLKSIRLIACHPGINQSTATPPCKVATC